MTGPQSGQLGDVQGAVGAHTVGLADGGRGLPLLGWSTAGGDLRIPHFVGMHALQALPLFVLLLNACRRLRPVLLAAATFVATVVLLTSQALIGQSIVATSGIILTGGITVTVAAVVAAIALMIMPIGSRRTRPEPGGV